MATATLCCAVFAYLFVFYWFNYIRSDISESVFSPKCLAFAMMSPCLVISYLMQSQTKPVFFPKRKNTLNFELHRFNEFRLYFDRFIESMIMANKSISYYIEVSFTQILFTLPIHESRMSSWIKFYCTLFRFHCQYNICAQRMDNGNVPIKMI